jgi:cytochrome c oxidase cbb3-type subunit III
MSPNKKAGFWRCLGVVAPILAAATLLAPIRQSSAHSPRSNQQQANSSARPLADGRQIFEGRCAACHGLDGRGGERAPDIATRPAVQQRPDAKLYEIIKAGIPSAGMPAFPSLDDGTLKALIAYLRMLQGTGPVASIPGNPHNGEILFFGKARCAECHTLSGKGGFIASDLSVFGRGRSPAEIRDAILSPGGNPRANALVTVVVRGGEKFSGLIRNEDNFSLQLQALDGSFHFLDKAQIESMAPQPDFLMPSNYGSTLSAQELDDLIGFLMTIANKEHTAVPKKQPQDDEEEENE